MNPVYTAQATKAYNMYLSGQKVTTLTSYQSKGCWVAEKERFELSNRFTGYTISSRAPSTKLGDFSMPQALLVNMGYCTTGWTARQAFHESFVSKF